MNQITEAEAVALAERQGAQHSPAGFLYAYPRELCALANAVRDQTKELLAQSSGVVPECYPESLDGEINAWHCDSGDVQQAIASMQAKYEQLDEAFQSCTLDNSAHEVAATKMQAKLVLAEKLLRRYRYETHIGHQPHILDYDSESKMPPDEHGIKDQS